MNTKSIVLPKKLAKRVVGEPVVAEPVVAEPVVAVAVAEPVVAEPVVAVAEPAVAAAAEPVAPIEGATVCDRDPALSFPEWLNTIDGKSCSDPRFLPAEPARRQAEITRRLHLAWIAAKGGEG